MRRALPPRPLSVLLVLAATAVGGLSAAVRPAGACACGVAFGTAVTGERALLSLTDGTEQIVLSLDLRPATGASATADRRRPAIVLPVPATPTVAAVRADQADVFAQLQRATAPIRPAPPSAGEEKASGAAPRGDVSVLARNTIGGYDVTRLRAREPTALRRWLDAHGYVTPARAAPILRDYVARGWAFVAIRLAAGRGPATGTLRPLRIRFRSPRLVYPLRLSAASSRPVSLQLYVVGDHRVIDPRMDTYFAGNVDDLRPALSAPVRELLPGPYLTRLGIADADPKTIDADVAPRRAVSDRLFRASADYPYESAKGFATAPLPSELEPEPPVELNAPGGAAWLLLVLGVLVVIGAIMLVLRLSQRRG